MPPEEIVLHTLFENGVTEVNQLERYVRDDVQRYGGRLQEILRKLQTAYREQSEKELDEEDYDEEEDIVGYVKTLRARIVVLIHEQGRSWGHAWGRFLGLGRSWSGRHHVLVCTKTLVAWKAIQESSGSGCSQGQTGGESSPVSEAAAVHTLHGGQNRQADRTATKFLQVKALAHAIGNREWAGKCGRPARSSSKQRYPHSYGYFSRRWCSAPARCGRNKAEHRN